MEMNLAVSYRAWSRSYCELRSEEDTLYSIDLHNKTNYLKKKNKLGLLEATSRFFHENRKSYYVTILKQEIPVNFLEINNGFILVGFLDSLGRQYLQYVFYEITPGKVFLKDATFWEFAGSNTDPSKIICFYFEPDGLVKIEEQKGNSSLTRIAQQKVDVTVNWEDYPEFGHYEKLIQKERIKI